IRARIVAISFVGGGVATASINIAAKGGCHQTMVGKRVVPSHRPGIGRNIINLDVKIGADGSACDAVDLAVKISRGMEVRGNGVRRQTRVIGIADRVVAPKRGRGSEVLVYATQ